MGELSLTPWRRYGHDRVYVADGATRLGFLDRATGILINDASREAEVRAALVAAGHLEARAAEPEPWAITLPGDTATYHPGAGARRMAAAEREAAPVRTTLARVLGVHTGERAWRRGAEGEEEVARRLARLPDGWVVLHDLPVGDRGANVDHLAIGPGGVVTMNTKNLGGKVWVGGDTFLCNGHREPYVRNARYEATRVARLLSAHGQPVDVRGVIVVMAPELVVKRQPCDVTVVARRAIRRWLSDLPPVLAREQVSRLERLARDPRTWAA
jgi:hypothetical protein